MFLYIIQKMKKQKHTNVQSTKKNYIKNSKKQNKYVKIRENKCVINKKKNYRLHLDILPQNKSFSGNHFVVKIGNILFIES